MEHGTRRAFREGLSLSLLVAASGLAAAGCGGRAPTRVVTHAEPSPLPVWERPSRMSDAKPAVRLDDEKAACAGECKEDATTALTGEADGVRVSLQPGMTLYSLARAYQVPLQTIMRTNRISDPTTIRAGTQIYIPASSEGASPSPPAPRAPRAAGKPSVPESTPETGAGKGQAASFMSIAWPLEGRITGSFGLRGHHHHHDGIDIDGTRGEEVRAVAEGIVVRSGDEGKYGRTVVIDHGNGLTTLYAHASRLLVREGDQVDQGEAIAEVGATGNAHGTHLHFEVRRHGRPVDPMPYLKPEMMGPASR